MKTIQTTLLLATMLVFGVPNASAVNDLLEWRHDYVSGLTPNSKGVDVSINEEGEMVTVAYTTTGNDEKWMITRHDAITGTVVWQKTVAVAGYDCRPVAVEIDYYGYCYVTGYVGGPNGEDIRTIGFNADGIQIWTHTFGEMNGGHDRPVDLRLDVDGEVIVTGSAAGSAGDLVTYRLNRNNGTEVWKKLYSTSFTDSPTALASSPYDNFVCVSGKTRVGSTVSSLVIRYDLATGAPTINLLDVPAKDDEATSVATDGLTIYVAGKVRNSASSYTARVMRVDAGGLAWERTYDAPGGNTDVNPRLSLVPRSMSFADVVLCCEASIDAQRKGFHLGRWKSDGTLVWEKDSVTASSPAGTYEHLRAYGIMEDRSPLVLTSNEATGGTSSEIQVLRYSPLDARLESRVKITGTYLPSVVVPASLQTNRLGQIAIVGTTSRTALGIEDFLVARLSRLFMARGERVSGPGLSPNAVIFGIKSPTVGHWERTFARTIIKDGSRLVMGLHGYGSLLLVQGQSFADIPGARFASLGDPVTSGMGSLAFMARLSGVPAAESLVICNYLYDKPVLMLQSGKAVPGAGGARLGSVVSYAHGGYGIVALVRLAGPGVTSANSLALIGVANKDTGHVVVRAGESLTIDGSTSKVKGIHVMAPGSKSPGHGRSFSHIQSRVVAAVTLVDGRRVLLHYDFDTGVRTLQLATGGIANAVNGQAKWHGFGQPCIGAWGDTQGVIATLKPGLGGVTQSNDTAIVAPNTAGGAGAWTLVARESSQVPGIAGAVYKSFYPPLTDTSYIAYIAKIKGNGINSANNTTLWYGSKTSPQLVTRTDMFATDGTGANTLNKISAIKSFAIPTYRLIYLANLKGKGVKASNNVALYGVDSKGLKRELLRKGQSFGSSKLLSFSLFKTVPFSAGGTRSFNDSATIAIQVTLNDGRSGVLLRRVP
ncbi:MAG: PQQ-like beta-propeller repeat protein [Verrucomicrobiaceae bacterium]|nr:PQQ-like beta-propeller repeat protein [Verrucomicrobiaceae bacterium]